VPSHGDDTRLSTGGETLDLLAPLILGSAALAAYGVTQLPSAGGRRRLVRLAEAKPELRPEVERSVLTQEPPRWLRWLVRRSSDETPSPTKTRLVQAGLRQAFAPAVYGAARVGLALATPTIVLIARPASGLEGGALLAALGCAAGIGFVAPSTWLDARRNARQRAVLLGLPDALDLMVVCVEAGLGINASLARIARELRTTHRVLSQELELVTLEIRTGKSTSDALRALATRTGVSEVSALVAMLMQTERFGTSLAETLRVHADGMRVRRMQRAEEIAGRAPLKMMFPTVLIFVATLIVTIGPGFLQISNFFEER
jgi:tight adherence protein C